MAEAHANWRLAQAAPGWDPAAELSDFQLLTLVQVHEVYQQARAEMEEEAMRKKRG